MILSKRETLYNKYFIKNGIITVRDIINKRGEIICWLDAQQKYSLNNSYFINWLGLIKCIPKQWEDKLRNNGTNKVNDENTISEQSTCVTARSAYQKLIEHLVIPPTSQKTLEKSLELKMSNGEKSICYQE